MTENQHERQAMRKGGFESVSGLPSIKLINKGTRVDISATYYAENWDTKMKELKCSWIEKSYLERHKEKREILACSIIFEELSRKNKQDWKQKDLLVLEVMKKDPDHLNTLFWNK